MTAICIDNDGMYLTIGKEYRVQKDNGDYIYIMNDIGRVSEYNCRYFIIEE